MALGSTRPNAYGYVKYLFTSYTGRMTVSSIYYWKFYGKQQRLQGSLRKKNVNRITQDSGLCPL